MGLSLAVVITLGLVVVIVVRADASTPVAMKPIGVGETLSGVVGAPDGASSVAQFAAWRGSHIDLAVDYLGSKSWHSMTQATWAPLRYKNSPLHVVWSLPLLPSEGDSTLAIGATGAYDAYFRTIADQLVAGGQGASTIRLGWEMNGDWFAWSALKDPVSYVAFYRHAATAMRSSPGSSFTFDFNIALMGPGNIAQMYPGDAYVDYIGADVYDWSWASSYPAQDHARVWSELLTGSNGLMSIRDFAASHGKRLTFPEWGLSYRCDGHGGGDDPEFVSHMRAFFVANRVAYESYFDRDDNACQRFKITANDFPESAKRYRNLWLDGFPVTTPPPTTSGSVTPASTPTATSTSIATHTPVAVRKGDLNNDGRVNVLDLSILLSKWGTAGGDVTGDGATNVLDLSTLLTNWSP